MCPKKNNQKIWRIETIFTYSKGFCELLLCPCVTLPVYRCFRNECAERRPPRQRSSQRKSATHMVSKIHVLRQFGSVRARHVWILEYYKGQRIPSQVGTTNKDNEVIHEAQGCIRINACFTADLRYYVRSRSHDRATVHLPYPTLLPEILFVSTSVCACDSVTYSLIFCFSDSNLMSVSLDVSADTSSLLSTTLHTSGDIGKITSQLGLLVDRMVMRAAYEHPSTRQSSRQGNERIEQASEIASKSSQ